MTRPEQDSTKFGLASNGNRIWQEDGRGPVSRINFRYYTSGTGAGRVRAVERPGGVVDSVTYDELGNVDSTQTPRGFWTSYENDDIGRTVVVKSPIDTLRVAVQIDSTRYDLMDRVTRQATFGPALPLEGSDSTPAQKLVVLNYYNPAGLLDSLHRVSEPDPSGIDTIKTQWRYDAAMRRVKEIAPDGAVDEMSYDAAGNVDMLKTRRGFTITMTYDALNRLVSRSAPSVTYHDTTAGLASRDRTPYPSHPNSGSDYVIDGQVESFTYDPVGHVVTANNADARVTRTYYPDGAVQSERQRLRDASGASFSHDFLLRYSYDLDGRRTAVRLPPQLVPAGTRDSIARMYSSLTGELSQVVDPLGYTFTYGYNDRGEPTSLLYPGDYAEHWGYNVDGQLTGDTIVNLGGTSGSRLAAGLGRAMTLTYDARGKLLGSSDATGYLQKVVSQYTGLGALATNYSWQEGELQGYPITHTYATGEVSSIGV